MQREIESPYSPRFRRSMRVLIYESRRRPTSKSGTFKYNVKIRSISVFQGSLMNPYFFRDSNTKTIFNKELKRKVVFFSCYDKIYEPVFSHGYVGYLRIINHYVYLLHSRARFKSSKITHAAPCTCVRC